MRLLPPQKSTIQNVKKSPFQTKVLEILKQVVTNIRLYGVIHELKNMWLKMGNPLLFLTQRLEVGILSSKLLEIVNYKNMLLG